MGGKRKKPRKWIELIYFVYSGLSRGGGMEKRESYRRKKGGKVEGKVGGKLLGKRKILQGIKSQEEEKAEHFCFLFFVVVYCFGSSHGVSFPWTFSGTEIVKCTQKKGLNRSKDGNVKGT